ncbi:MAG: haloacid dehalogenase-like hydrolase [Labedaea sp.]
MLPTLNALLGAQARHVPLVVDFDGTLCCADTLLWLRQRCVTGRGELEEGRVRARTVSKQAEKVYLWHQVGLPVEELPYETDLIDALKAERATGRAVVLATGSARGFAEAVADHLGIFDRAMGTDESVNMTGVRKSAALQRAFGQRGFDYVGDSAADVPVWQSAGQGILLDRPGAPAFAVPDNVVRVRSARALEPFPTALRLNPLAAVDPVSTGHYH